MIRSRVTPASLAGFAVIAAGCNQAPEAGVARADGGRATTKVATVKPDRATVRRLTEQPGQLEPYEVTPIHAKIAGYVKSVAVDIGARVTKGQILAELDEPETVAELGQKRAVVEQAVADKAQAEAAVEVAAAHVVSAQAKADATRAAIHRAEADVVRYQSEFGRADQLTRERAATGSLRDEARSKLEAARAALDEAKAGVASADALVVEAKAGLDKARADVGSFAARVDVARADARRVEALLGYARIAAPYDGVVTRRNVDTGHLTSPGIASQPLFVVARTDRLTVVVGVREADAPLVVAGAPARVRFPTLGGRIVEGEVTRTSATLDESTRTLRAEIDLPNTKNPLQPGAYAYASIVVEEHASALTVPATAIVRGGGKAYCVVVADGQAKRREVAVGLIDGARAEITAGLTGDDAVVAANADSLTDGQAVSVERKDAPPVKP